MQQQQAPNNQIPSNKSPQPEQHVDNQNHLTYSVEPTQQNEAKLQQQDEQSEDDVYQQQDSIDQEEIQTLKFHPNPTGELIEEEQISEDDVSDEDEDRIGDDSEEEQKEDVKRLQMETQINKQHWGTHESEDGKQKKIRRQKDRIKLHVYQNILFNHSLNRNSIIYLPTGKGKTLVSIASMYYYLCKNGQNKKMVFLANTIQLVKQQADAIKKCLQKIMHDDELASSLTSQINRGRVKWSAEQIRQKVCCIHGQKQDQVAGTTRKKKIQSQLTSKKQMLEMFKKSTIVVMIAQMFLNCLRRGYIKITDFSFMVLDECHHCHGDHPYAGIMRQFYFNPPKPDEKQLKKLQLREEKLELPIIMGLTASPVMQQAFDKDKIIKQIRELCGNLKSRFTSYQIEKIQKHTDINIIGVQQQQQRRKSIPLLIAHFQKFTDQKQSYLKIKKHFPDYFECVQKVISLLISKHEKQMSLQANPDTISDIQLLLFYDIKQCLLTKLRDIWLQLGQFAFTLAFEDLFFKLDHIIFKSEENKQTILQIKKILQEHIIKLKNKYGKCQPQFFSSKVNKLIQILEKKSSDSSNEMVVVFASKRRTVWYLQKLIQIYSQSLPEDQKNNLKSGKVTGYSAKTASDYSRNITIYESDPSSFRFYAQAESKYNNYLSELNEEKVKINLSKNKQDQSESKNLESELRRMRSVKYGKLLLEVQEKYSTQISTIKKFRQNQFRILITTSVTEEGFDIPRCKIVISFNKPYSLKSYIQIKGRARQQQSKYYIFTSNLDYEKMVKNKQYYDDIINATYKIAIDKFSYDSHEKQQCVSSIIQKDYERKLIGSSGAMINTNYSLQILKMYCASLRHPNKLLFYFIETPNLAFRCLIFFPKSAPTSKPYICGQSRNSKNLALKSAAYLAVRYLYEEKYIKEDLRPKKYEEIEDERQIEKFDDLEETRKNEVYKKIFQEQVRIKCENISDRRFMRFYFKTIKTVELDFPYVNPNFKKHLPTFEKQKFPFQIYMMNFNNSRNMKELKKEDDKQEVGILACFQSKYIEQAFSGYQYSFEESNGQKFTLKLEEDNLRLDKSEYQRLKRVHQFLVCSSQSRQAYHYSNLTNKKPYVSRWLSQMEKFKFIQPDPQRQYYPIMVVLKKKNGRYSIDQQCLINIEKHQQLFKKVYEYYNFSGKFQASKFPISLKSEFDSLAEEIKSSKCQGDLLVQGIERQNCFTKFIISQRQPFNADSEKDKDKLKGLTKRIKNLSVMHGIDSKEIRQVVKIIYWSKFKKERKKQIFERSGKLSFKEVQNSRYFLLPEFVIYPLTSALLFKCCLAADFAFKAVFEYTLAFEFRNNKLPSIFKQKLKLNKNQFDQPFTFYVSPNIILENGPAIFQHLATLSSSQYLRNIGKSFKQGSNFKRPAHEFSFSKINISNINMDESSIMDNKTNILSQSINISGLELSMLDGPNASKSLVHEKEFVEYSEDKSLNLVSQIKVTQMLKVLTSKMYKHNKIDNYQEYQFIGDVVLKMLSTVQVFLDKPQADESELHISRANIVCNANLHRKCILKNIYRYILTKKRDELPPPYRYCTNEGVVEQLYQKTTFKLLNENNEIQGFNYIPGKVHADIIQGLIGAFYLHSKELNDCQLLLYFLDILKKPTLKINYQMKNMTQIAFSLPKMYQSFEQRIGYTFKNKSLLIQSLTHSSFKSTMNIVIDKINIDQIVKSGNKSSLSQSRLLSADVKELNKNAASRILHWETFYQRFQFLGDSILDLIVVEYLHEKFGTKDQGTLSALKQAAVSNKSLGMIAISYGMHQLILMDYPQNDEVMKEFQLILQSFNHFLNNPSALINAKVNSIKILGDVFEALVGAIFIDLELDYVQTKEVIMKIIKDYLVHYTDLQTMKKTSTFKYQQFLEKNNYRECRLRKDTTQEIVNGNFKYILVDKSGKVVDQCWQTTEKRAWDVIYQQFYARNTNTFQINTNENNLMKSQLSK